MARSEAVRCIEIGQRKTSRGPSTLRTAKANQLPLIIYLGFADGIKPSIVKGLTATSVDFYVFKVEFQQMKIRQWIRETLMSSMMFCLLVQAAIGQLFLLKINNYTLLQHLVSLMRKISLEDAAKSATSVGALIYFMGVWSIAGLVIVCFHYFLIAPHFSDLRKVKRERLLDIVLFCIFLSLAVWFDWSKFFGP